MESMGLSELFGGVYSGRRVLVTGHTGFKGSWLVSWLSAMGAHVAGLALDPDTESSHWNTLNLKEVADHRVDLRDAAAVRKLLRQFRPEMVFHLAAQPLVRRSYREPTSTFDVNVLGLVNLLEAVRACPSVQVVVNATTDKVYAELAGDQSYRENDALGGHDPYSSSKACAEIVSACYRKSFFQPAKGRGSTVRLATARSGNVIGGGDWAEDRLVPDLIRAANSGQALQIRNPTSTRPWQHVLEPLSGYLRLGQALLDSERYADAWNFGPGRDGERSVQELTARFAAIIPELNVERDASAHPHEAVMLRLDCAKALRELQWRSVWSIGKTVERTAAWYRSFLQSGVLQTSSDIGRYVADAKGQNVEWAR